MAVAFDAASESHTGTTGNTGTPNPFTWTHVPAGTPRAAVVLVFTISGSPLDTAVSYGGAAMSAVPYTGFDTDTEPGGCKAWFLDNVPSGSQVVSVTRSGTATVYAVCLTVTASGRCVVYEPGVQTKGGSTSNTAASSSGTGTGSAGVLSVDDGGSLSSSLRILGQYYGGPSPLAAASGSVAGPSIDLGAFVAATYYEATPGTGARSVGSAAGTDDLGVVALAVREALQGVDIALVEVTAAIYELAVSAPPQGLALARIATPRA